MKFSFLSLFCFFSWFMLNSTIIYVDGNNTQGPWDGSLGYPWQFIQDGIDNASDNDIVSVEDGVYDENLYIQNLSISVKSQSENPELCTINGSSQKVIELYHTSDTDKVLSIIGFTIIGSMEYKGIYASKYQYSNGSFTVNIRKNIFQDFLFCMDIHELDYCEISDNSLTNSSQIINSYGIVIIELDEISIYNNYISNFKYGICFLLSNADVYNNEIEVYYNEGVGIKLHSDSEINIMNNLILLYGQSTGGSRIGVHAGPSSHITNIINNTVVGFNTNTTGYRTDSNTITESFYNNILWNLEQNIDNSNSIFEVDYCCYNGLLPSELLPGDDHNVTSNPDFIGHYELEWIDDYNHSPCINAGNVDIDNDGEDYRIDPDDRDLDNSRLDIGCYPHYFDDRDFKYYYKGWNWDSFPRLDRIFSINEEEDIIPILNNIDPFINITDIDLDYYDNIQYLYDFPSWNYLEYDVYSTNLYKIEVTPPQPRELTIMGTCMEADYTLEETIEANEWYWLGYWYPENRNIMDAFSNNWDDLTAVLAEDWAYSRQQRGRFDPEPPIWSPDGKTMEYGKGYIVKFDQPIPGFQWSEFGRKEDPLKKESSTYFTYTELPSYEPIDIINSDFREQIIEIGVFENELCVGAVVIDELPVQLLAYTGQEECDELSFQIITTDRSRLAINEYMVYNKTTGNFEYQELKPRNQEYSIISLDPGNSDIVPEPHLKVYQNYPNPFNPETTISFYNPNEQPVKLTIFNLKGQKVKHLFDEVLSKGDHSIIWNGQDENNESVASGFYFYKVESKSKSSVKKMLLIK